MLSAIAFLPVGGQALADRIRDQQWHLPFSGRRQRAQAQPGRRHHGGGHRLRGLQQHPDLTGNVLQGLDVVAGGSGNGWGDIDGHGTGMAG